MNDLSTLQRFESKFKFKIDTDDIIYEEDVSRNPLSVNSWLRYLEFKDGADQATRNFIYERSLREMPRSYKIWHKYLIERSQLVRGKCIDDESYEQVNSLYERSLIFLNKMPRIWIEYCEFLILQRKITKTRRTFDRALRSLPLTQHSRIWGMYLDFVKMDFIPVETSIKVYKRYLKIESKEVENYIEFLIKLGAWEQVSIELLNIINQDSFTSTRGKSKHDLWLELVDILSNHPRDISDSIDIDAIIRAGISQFSDQVGKLWSSLADYYIKLAQFEKARDIFEEALEGVPTARDFSFIWDSYTQFEDSLISAKQELISEIPGDNEKLMELEQLDFELMLERYESLISRQPLLLNSVLLRQNPNNVGEWLKRVQLIQTSSGNDQKQVIQVYSKAVETVDPHYSKGKLFTLWVSFAKYYESLEKFDQARKIFEAGTKVNYRTVDDLASIWCEYAEFELRLKSYDRALELLKRATISPRKFIKVPDSEPVQKRLFKSTKLWSFYVDLEESFGTFHSTKSIYDKMIQLKVITPQILLNYTDFLEENKYFEDSFKAYEQGIALFPFPNVQFIWITYLSKFIARYGGTKLERTRDLFEQAISKCPPDLLKIFYLMYANYEEQYGLARHSMEVYDRAASSVAVNDRFNIYILYILRSAEYFGINQTREIFRKAIESLPDKFSREMCIRFAEMERNYGEIDRARAIFIHGSQISDPRSQTSYWEQWQQFEKDHGNEDTFLEMLRIKRSVLAQFNSLAPVLNLDKINEKLNQDKSNSKSVIQSNPVIIKPITIKNNDEINIDENDDDNGNDNFEIEQKQIPTAVFSSNIK